MWRNRLLGTALLLLVAALPLVSIGMQGGRSGLWRAGLAALAAGGLIGLLSRIVRTGQKADGPAGEHDR